MKIKLLPILLFVFAFSSINFAQSITIKPHRIVYNRKGATVPDYKRTFNVIYPQVEGKLNPKIKDKIESLLNYEKIFEISIQESIDGDTYLSEFSYKIKYNKNNILDILLIMEGVGAYPWTEKREILINLKTGNQIKAKDVFKVDSFNVLLKKIRHKMQFEINKTIETNGNFTELQNAKFSLENLNDLSITDKGVTFFYDYEFPFAVLSIEPTGRFFFSYVQLKLYIKPDGLLGKFVS